GVPQPVFSEDWQFQESFSTTGGQLRGRNSDVILIVPEHAVTDASQESLCEVKKQALADVIIKKGSESSANINEAVSSEVSGQAREAHDINNDVIIRGAISTDLKRVHETLHLGRCDSVRSPAAEYFAGENFSFQKPVSISLPHFLPPGFSAADVRVYQFHRDSDGQILVNTLKPLKTEDTSDKHTASNTPGTSAENDVTATEGFYFTDDNRIQVVTSHFSGYLCTLCKKEMDPPHLRLRLYGKHAQRQSRDVDLTLFIWDLRLDIRDFRKAGLPNPEEEKTFQASQTLEPLATTAIENVQLGVHLRLSEQEEAIWMHMGSGGEPFLNSERRIGVKKFVPCCLDTIPERVDWALLTRHDPGQLRWFQCVLDVGYVTAAVGDVPLQFLPVPPMQSLRIRGLELLNEQRSAKTQTDQHLMENTHVKQLEGNFPSLRTTAEAPSTTSSPPFSLLQTAAVQDASAYYGQRQYVATASTPPRHQGLSSSSDSVSNIHQSCTGGGMAAMSLNPGRAAANHSRAASPVEEQNAVMSFDNGGTMANQAEATPIQKQNTAMSFVPEVAIVNQARSTQVHETMPAMVLNPPVSAASPSRGHQVAGSCSEVDNSTKQVIYTNCTFNMQANKSTTNNNVGKLHKMSFGNTTNIATEGDQAEGGTPHHVTPPHHVMEPRIEFPDVAEVLQQSLAQQVENEPLQ
ncbi:uncharacterized protein, partial [Littorina saxatilis]|uniref:uncharacterized protein n=1 Tax=Littorina saxatilis TaxID=31220 RepID=UPI0038B523E9